MQPAVPKFDGYHDHWSMLMENLLRSKEYRSIVEGGVPVTTETTTTEQIKVVEDAKLKNLKTENYLFQSIDRGSMERILDKDTTKGFGTP